MDIAWSYRYKISKKSASLVKFLGNTFYLVFAYKFFFVCKVACIDLLLGNLGFFHRQIGPPTGSETSLKHDVNCIQNVSTRRLSLQWRQFADDHRLITTCRRIRTPLFRETEIIIIKFVVVHKVQREKEREKEWGIKIEFRSLSQKYNNCNDLNELKCIANSIFLLINNVTILL